MLTKQQIQNLVTDEARAKLPSSRVRAFDAQAGFYECLSSAAPNTRDEKLLTLAASAQVHLAIAEFEERSDLQLSFLGVRPECSAHSDQLVTPRVELQMCRSVVGDHYFVAYCSPPEYALALSSATMGMKRPFESCRAQAAKICPVRFEPHKKLTSKGIENKVIEKETIERYPDGRTVTVRQTHPQ